MAAQPPFNRAPLDARPVPTLGSIIGAIACARVLGADNVTMIRRAGVQPALFLGSIIGAIVSASRSDPNLQACPKIGRGCVESGPMNNTTTFAENSGRTARPRGPGRPFTKGVSGNPGGRPRELADVKALAREHTTEAIETLVTLMREGRTDTARAAAASELLSRAWGKATTPLEHRMPEPPQMFLTDQQVEAIVELGLLKPTETDDRRSS
jgi:hypothetical protein